MAAKRRGEHPHARSDVVTIFRAHITELAPAPPADGTRTALLADLLLDDAPATLYQLRAHPGAGLFTSATAAVAFAFCNRLDPTWDPVS